MRSRLELHFPHRGTKTMGLLKWQHAATTLHLVVCLSSASLHQSTRHVAEAQIRKTQAVGGGRRWETYLPSTAATTLQLSSCSYRALSIRSRRSALRTRLIINTWVHTNAQPHTHASVIVCVCVCVCFACVLVVGCAYLIKAHLVRLLGRKRQEARGLQWRISHFQRKNRGRRLQREWVMWWNRGSQTVAQGSSGDFHGAPKMNDG